MLLVHGALLACSTLTSILVSLIRGLMLDRPARRLHSRPARQARRESARSQVSLVGAVSVSVARLIQMFGIRSLLAGRCGSCSPDVDVAAPVGARAQTRASARRLVGADLGGDDHVVERHPICWIEEAISRDRVRQDREPPAALRASSARPDLQKGSREGGGRPPSSPSGAPSRRIASVITSR